uniref:Uncharacterized protein n=1 Tax=Vespula pensylvanica TaxID=30213 RepID=A0A834P0R9_VESPE|nr:hypothetical protein H0235_008912 [Vespula pensylvanica]
MLQAHYSPVGFEKKERIAAAPPNIRSEIDSRPRKDSLLEYIRESISNISKVDSEKNSNRKICALRCWNLNREISSSNSPQKRNYQEKSKYKNIHENIKNFMKKIRSVKNKKELYRASPESSTPKVRLEPTPPLKPEPRLA